MSPRETRVRSLFASFIQKCSVRIGRKLVLAHALLLVFATLFASGQTVTFNAPFSSITQSQVTYGQGIVADAESNLYITGTVNLLYLQRNANGTYTPAATKIDSVGGTGYGLAIDASNNLYRPDIAPGSYPALAKYIYQGLNSFQKYSIGTWGTTNRLSSVAVDSNYNVYVLDAGGSGTSTGSIVELTPSSSCASLSACTSYTQTTLVTDAKLFSATGLSLDVNGNFYFTSGSVTGNSPTVISSSTAAVYKLMPSGNTYSFYSLGSNWNSPAATAVDSLGNIWVADYGAQKIYQLLPASSSASETSYTVTQFQSSTTFACLRTLTVSKTGQLFGLESGGPGCNSSAVPEVGGTPPHNAGTPSVGAPAVQEVDITFSAPQNPVSYRVVTQGSTAIVGFSDVTPPTGSTAGGTPYCTQGTGSGYTCAILAQFYPNTPGLEEGAVLVLNSSGTVIGTNYIYGVGYGAEATLAPGQTTTYAASQLLSPAALAVDAFSNLYAADPGANLVRLISSGGTASTLAGTGLASTSLDASCGNGGLATSTNLTISGVALDGAGNLYLADPNQNRVCALNLSTGVLSTVAGTGASCSSSTASCGDGSAAIGAQLALRAASGLAVDGLGNLLIADSGDNRLRSVNLNTGVITTVAGTGGTCSGTATCGDGGLATAAGAYLNNPTAVAVDATGDYLIVDTGDNRVRQVSELTSALSTVAGSGTAGLSGDGSLAISAQLSSPRGVAVDAAGDLYIADQGNNRVRMVTKGNGNIVTLVGGGVIPPPSNPTSATSARLNSPAAVAVDGSGNLLIAAMGDSIIEKVSAGATSFTFPAITAVGSVDSADGLQTASLLNIGNVTLTHVSPGITSPVDFQRLTGNAGDCSPSFALAAGTSCEARMEFYPQTSGSFNESLVFTDNALGASPATQTVTLIGTSATPTITLSPSSALPAAQAGIAYSQTFTASGGAAPYSFAVTSGSLPSGLTLTSSGVLSGTPTTASSLGSFVITASDSSSSSNGGPFSGNGSYALQVNPGAASKLATGAVAATLISSGNLGTVTATVEDANGNTVSTSTASVTLTITGPNGFSQTVTAIAVNGVASLDLSSIVLNNAGSYTLTTSSPGLTGTSAPVTVTAGAAAKLATSTVAATLVSGGNLGTVTATVEDANGNTATTSTASITLTITGPNGYSQIVTAAAANGVASLNLGSLPLTVAGSYTVTAASPGLTGTSTPVTVTAGAAAKLATSTVAATGISGGNLGAVTATVEDANGNTVTNSTAPITLIITGPNGFIQTVPALAVNGVATLDLSSFPLNAAGSYTVTTSSAGLTGTSTPVTVTAGAAAKLATSTLVATLVSGSNLGTLTVKIEDTNGNTVTTSTASVTLTITGPNGYSQTVTAAAVSGAASLNLNSLPLTTAGSYTVTTASPGLTGTSTPVTVTAGTAARLATSAAASTLVAGANLGTITLTVQDTNGNTVTNSTASVALTITGPNGYSHTLTATAVNGVASLNLSSVALNTAGSYTVTTTSQGLTGTSTPVSVTAGVAAKLATSTVAAVLVSGDNLGTITATVEDASSNTSTGSTAPVTLTITGPNGYSQTLTAAAENGVANLNVSSLALKLAGTYTVTSSSPGLTGTTTTVNVTAGAAAQIITSGVAASITSGQSLGTATATVEDANGNVVTTYTGSLAATLTGPNGYSQTVTGTAVNGIVTFNLGSLNPTAAGAYTLTLTGSGLTSASAPSTAISVAAAAQTIALPPLPPLTLGAGSTALPTTSSAGLPITYTVTGPAVLNGSTLTITGAGTVTITATQAGDASHSATVVTDTFTVAKAASTTKLVSSSGVATTGTAVTLTAQVGVPTGTPTGTVAFMNGSTILGTAPVSSGSATLTLSTLPTGALSLTAAYSGDTNFVASTSAAVVTEVQDFGIAATTGTPSVAVVPGASATFTLSLTPGTAGFSSSIALKATGLPPGATYSFSPATLTPGSGAANTVLTVQTAKPVETARNLGGAAGFALALVGLPFSFSRKARRALKRGGFLAVLGAMLLLGGVAGLTGCGTSNGFFGQPAQSYTVTVTATSNTLSHATTVVLNVQ